MRCLNPVLESERLSERLWVCQREANESFLLENFWFDFGFAVRLSSVRFLNWFIHFLGNYPFGNRHFTDRGVSGGARTAICSPAQPDIPSLLVGHGQFSSR